MSRKRIAPVVPNGRLKVGDVVRFDAPGPCQGYEGVVVELFTDECCGEARALVDLGESVHPCLRYVQPYDGDLVERRPVQAVLL